MNRYVKHAAKSLIEKLYAYRCHQVHRQQARKTLNSLESAHGKTDPQLIKLSDEYASEVLGWRGYAPWLYVYSAVAGRFKEGWIPENYYGKVVLPAVKGDYGKVSDLKPLTKKLFNSSVFPDSAYYVNGLFFSDKYEVLRDDEVPAVLFKSSPVIVFKVDNSLQGKGVSVFKKDSFDPQQVRLLGNGVFQHYIEQHEFFDGLMPTSVATLRVTTVLDDKGVYTVRACYLRIGRSADAHVKSASHVRVPVDLQSGALDAQGYLPTWLTIDRHPDTHVAFAKKIIPCFGSCLSTVLELHKLMPYARCIGWDLIVDKQQSIKVMEWNGNHNDIKFSEATQGPCFSDLGWEKIWRKPKPNAGA